jgi:hypothetical protein
LSSREVEWLGPGIYGRGKVVEGLERVAKVIDERKRVLSSVERMAIGINLIGVEGGRLRFIPCLLLHENGSKGSHGTWSRDLQVYRERKRE